MGFRWLHSPDRLQESRQYWPCQQINVEADRAPLALEGGGSPLHVRRLVLGEARPYCNNRLIYHGSLVGAVQKQQVRDVEVKEVHRHHRRHIRAMRETAHYLCLSVGVLEAPRLQQGGEPLLELCKVQGGAQLKLPVLVCHKVAVQRPSVSRHAAAALSKRQLHLLDRHACRSQLQLLELLVQHCHLGAEPGPVIGSRPVGNVRHSDHHHASAVEGMPCGAVPRRLPHHQVLAG
mmetsp:Transcript_5016/g.14033  ORF Transcript_5016/g.14033 Transcript_5016/m.14033 type:complete len:234 (+) Transcript_5016:830-1531(+)